MVSQIKVKKAAIFQRPSKQAKRFVLTNWLDVEKLPARSLLEDNSDIVKTLSTQLMARPINEILANVSDPYEKSFLENFEGGLAVPLHLQWGLIGILMAGPKSGNSSFTDEDKEFLALLSGQVAVALENARLHEAEKKAIAELQATQEQLVHTERLAALGEMSAKIAHEINNPLGIIKNYLMLIRKASQDPSQSAKYLEIVGQEIERITGIVRELLQFHRPQQVDYNVINVLNVLEDVIGFLAPRLAQAKIKCTRKFSPDSPPVEASAENLKQVFINILLNAIDALPNGGDINIRTCRHDHNLLIQFYDSGPGVPEEHLPRIFEPFFTTKEDGKGTGLGLAVCYGIIKKHQGTITFKNTDEGGCVEITLPAAGSQYE